MAKKKILVSDKLSSKGIDLIKDQFEVDVKPGLSEDELTAIINNYEALLVRSETKVTARILAAANNLKIIGRAGVGVDNIDIPAATKKGIIVVNSPEGNTIAAAEHSLALLLGITRNIPFAHNSMQKGEWKRGEFTGVELFGKKLGVIGLGKIGRRVVSYAQCMGMQIMGFDPYINEEYLKQLGIKIYPLDEVLSQADYITFHIPKTKETQHMIDKKKFRIMKKGVYIINCARGGIIVEQDLKEAVESGIVKGAAVDVYEEEPIKPDNVLLGVKNIITTPHIGAATEEAKENVAIDVVEQVRDVLNGGEARSAVNTL
ncbi:MAG: hydroxyacid dehydrogenase [Candidatus Margulisbacteria bacterium]|nr:hydroxyacid dehydrogenase [Candidatus Margulisiibacteriota bacterium]